MIATKQNVNMVTSLKKKVMGLSREKKLMHFYSYFQEGQSVLDVGVSAEVGAGISARNYFLKNYRHDPKTYTGLGVQDLSGMEYMFPGKRFVQYSGKEFPFENKEFDWVFSNAVIEHVCGEQRQLLFINEMIRVAKSVFFTTPNKNFPVETHTNALFIHWHDNLFQKWCKKKGFGYNRRNLYLLSIAKLHSLMKRSRAVSFSIQKNRLLGLPMTFTVVCTEKPD